MYNKHIKTHRIHRRKDEKSTNRNNKKIQMAQPSTYYNAMDKHIHSNMPTKDYRKNDRPFI